ncbi:MAG: hypothetical protein ACLSHQ_08025 [Faecalibacterium sp.]
MRIDRVKLIAEMARQDVGVADLSQRATVSRATITALRGGKVVTQTPFAVLLPLWA